MNAQMNAVLEGIREGLAEKGQGKPFQNMKIKEGGLRKSLGLDPEKPMTAEDWRQADKRAAEIRSKQEEDRSNSDRLFLKQYNLGKTFKGVASKQEGAETPGEEALPERASVGECFEEYLESLVVSVQDARDCDRECAVEALGKASEALCEAGYLPPLPGLDDQSGMSVWMAQASLIGLEERVPELVTG